MDLDQYEMHAAGAAVWRQAPGEVVEWAVIHRPAYDDWTLPKGKLDPGEGFEAAAVREVREEIGITGTLGAELPHSTYNDRKGRSKIVRYWLMRAPVGKPFAVNEEVDRLDWLPAQAAARALTYDRDRDVLRAAVEIVGRDG